MKARLSLRTGSEMQRGKLEREECVADGRKTLVRLTCSVRAEAWWWADSCSNMPEWAPLSLTRTCAHTAHGSVEKDSATFR